jgi:hypothetical protein
LSILTLAVEVASAELDDEVLALLDAVAVVAPALMLLFTFMPHPPYGVVVFMVLVAGLRPLGSRVAIGGIALAHQRWAALLIDRYPCQLFRKVSYPKVYVKEIVTVLN